MANNIREKRRQKGITLELMSKELLKQGVEISADGLAKYERGIREPKIATWEKLADYFGVSVPELMGFEAIREINKQNARMIEAGNNMLLNKQLTRLQNTKLHKFEPSTLATAIKMVMDLYNTYDFNADETTDVSSILRALNFMITNSIDDDDDYQDTIDRFTKLVNNLKAQHKKSSDNKPETE